MATARPADSIFVDNDRDGSKFELKLSRRIKRRGTDEVVADIYLVREPRTEIEDLALAEAIVLATCNMQSEWFFLGYPMRIQHRLSSSEAAMDKFIYAHALCDKVRINLLDCYGVWVTETDSDYLIELANARMNWIKKLIAPWARIAKSPLQLALNDSQLKHVMSELSLNDYVSTLSSTSNEIKMESSIANKTSIFDLLVSLNTEQSESASDNLQEKMSVVSFDACPSTIPLSSPTSMLSTASNLRDLHPSKRPESVSLNHLNREQGDVITLVARRAASACLFKAILSSECSSGRSTPEENDIENSATSDPKP